MTTAPADPRTIEFVELAAAFAVLEEAAAPVPEDAFVALADPARRRQLSSMAAAAGRVLIEVRGGWLTGYDDAVADRLAEEGVGVLDPIDGAVLALVLLHTVVVPRARGQLPGDDWCTASGTDIAELAKNRTRGLSKDAISRSVRRLKARGIITSSPQGGIVPGPQLRRLTKERSAAVWTGIMVASRPHGLLAHAAARQREQRRSARGGQR